MKRMLKRLTLLAATIVAAASMLAGCSGSDGANGLPGANGTNGTNALATPSEACATCHTASVDAAHASSSTGTLAVSNIAVLPVGNDLSVTFNVKVNGVNKTNYDAIGADYRLYRVDPATLDRSDLSDAGATQTLTNNSNGNYTITIANAALNYGAINSR